MKNLLGALALVMALFFVPLDAVTKKTAVTEKKAAKPAKSKDKKAGKGAKADGKKAKPNPPSLKLRRTRKKQDLQKRKHKKLTLPKQINQKHLLQKAVR